MRVARGWSFILRLGGSRRALCCAALRSEANFPKYKLHSTSMFLFYVLKKFTLELLAPRGAGQRQAVAESGVGSALGLE